MYTGLKIHIQQILNFLFYVIGFEKYKTFLYKILETFNQFKKLQLKNKIVIL